MQEALTLFDYLGIFLKHRKIVLVFGISAFLLALINGINSKPLSVAKTVIWSSEPERTVEFLRGTNTLDNVIQSLNLSEVYGLEDLGNAREKLFNSLNINVLGKVISLEAREANPDLAAGIANELASEAMTRERDFSEALFNFQKEKIREIVRISNVSVGQPAETASVVVLSKATPPRFESQKLKIAIKSVFAGLLGMLLGIVLAFCKEYFTRHRSAWEEAKAKYLRN